MIIKILLRRKNNKIDITNLRNYFTGVTPTFMSVHCRRLVNCNVVKTENYISVQKIIIFKTNLNPLK